MYIQIVLIFYLIKNIFMNVFNDLSVIYLLFIVFIYNKCIYCPTLHIWHFSYTIYNIQYIYIYSMHISNYWNWLVYINTYICNSRKEKTKFLSIAINVRENECILSSTVSDPCIPSDHIRYAWAAHWKNCVGFWCNAR